MMSVFLLPGMDGTGMREVPPPAFNLVRWGKTLLSPSNYVWLTTGRRRARKDMKESAVYSSHSVVL
jgi:hypothetical protein